MSEDVKQILKKTAEYIACTQPIIDEYNEYKEAVVKEANTYKDAVTKEAYETIGVLVAAGIVAEEKKAETVSTLINDPLRVFGLVRGMADTLTRARTEKQAANSLGWVSDEPAKVSSMDPIERWARYGDHRVDSQPSNF